MEGLLPPETVELVTEKLEKTLQLIIDISKQCKYVLIGTGAIVGAYWYMTRKHGFFHKLGIPGPKPGLFGVFSEYQTKGIGAFDRELMKKYGKVVGIFHATQPVYMIADADMIKQITVKEFQHFVDRDNGSFPVDPLFKDSLVMIHGERWKLMRSILSPTFTSGRMKEITPLLQKCVGVLVENLWTVSEKGTKAMKMKDVFSQYGMDVIASTAFGVELDCQKDPDNDFNKNAKKCMEQGPRLWIPAALCMFFPFMKYIFEAFGLRTMDPKAGDFFVEIIHATIKYRKEHNVKRNDYLQLMLDSHKLEEDLEGEDPDTHLEFDKTKRRVMTSNEVVGNAAIFLLAGFEMNALAISYAAYCLATNPECQEKLIEEIDRVLNGKPPDYESISQLHYLENVVLETLRLFPPLIRTTRIASKDIEINGYLIKKGVEVHFPILAIQHDPDYWHDPETFDPDRFLPQNRPANYNYVFLAFGAGPRNCLGMRLANMETKMAIAGILQKYRFKPAPDTQIPPDLEKTTMWPTNGMMLMIEKR